MGGLIVIMERVSGSALRMKIDPLRLRICTDAEGIAWPIRTWQRSGTASLGTAAVASGRASD